MAAVLPNINTKKLRGLSAEATLDGGYIHQPIKLINMGDICNLASIWDTASAALWGGIEGVPHIGDRHPNLLGFVLESISAEPYENSDRQAVLMAHYRNLDYVKVNFSTTVSRETTLLDASGNVLAVNYDPTYEADIPVTTDIVTGKQNRDRKSTRLNSSHRSLSRMPSSA